MTGAAAADATERIADARLRLERLQEAIADSLLDALVLSSRANFVYATGYVTPSWAMTARPLALIVTPDHCAAVVGSGEVEALAAEVPHLAIIEYTDPIVREINGFVLADFAPAVTNAIARVLRPLGSKRLGIEGSIPSASGLPYTALQTLAEELALDLIDAVDLIWKLRQEKTPFEIERMRTAGTALGRLYELFQERAEPGLSERDIHALLLAAAGEVGADRLGYVTIVARNSPAGQPGDFRWSSGDLLYIDIGLVIDEYWADFSRHFAANDVRDEHAVAYRRIVAAVRAGRAACTPGATAADVAAAMAAELPRPAGHGLTSIGRSGHGVGLDLTEPPSLTPRDTTVLKPSITLAIEPLGPFAFGVLMAEENVVVTDGEADLLSPAFPTEIPIVTA